LQDKLEMGPVRTKTHCCKIVQGVGHKPECQAGISLIAI